MSKLPADHPFSIASLTASPEREKSGESSPPIITSGLDFMRHGHFYHTSPLMLATKHDVERSLKSPSSSTGSADCSPDTSFSSNVPFYDDISEPKSSRASSPAASIDSGRGSPPTLPVSPVEPRADQETREEQRQQKSPSDKPSHSYIALISMAILGSPERKLVLSDIYQYIMDHFPFYNNQERAWRNSIRHNLSLNECFIKAGRADNGKGNFWAIHPACVEDFAKGDFRRRQARRRARGAVASPDHMTAMHALRASPYPQMIPPSATPLHCYMPGFPYIPQAYSPLFNNSAEMNNTSPPGTPGGSTPPSSPAGNPHQGQFAMTSKIPSHANTFLASPYLALAASSGRPLLAMRNPSVIGHLSMPYSQESTSSVRYSPYGRPHSQMPPFW